MAKVKCIIKRPDEQYGHVTNISVSLENLQKTVEGYIEIVPLAGAITHARGLLLIVNEEGKLRNLEKNFSLGFATIHGTAIIIGRGENGEDFSDVPITFETWKKLLHSWGN